ncbi:hypothetical protein ABPG75_004475 [Micractinium tetrahymenae]
MPRWLSILLAIITCGLVRWKDADQSEATAPLLASPCPPSRRRERSQRRRRQRGPVDTKNILAHGHRSIAQDYVLTDVLGQGAFGVVRRAVHIRTGLRYAVKSVYKRQLRRRVDVEDLRREVQILGMLSSHPNVAALLQTYEDEEAVHIVLELCEGGELFDRVARQGVLTERVAAHFFRQIVSVLAHMHSLHIAHRDLKPENFMLSDNSDKARIKACDFGLSQFFSPGRPFHSLVGSAFYVAPEVLQREYGPQADVWSLGVCLFTLLSGLLPFFGETEEQVFDMVQYADLDLESQPWPQISPAAKDLVRRMLQRDPARRITPAQILQHPWMQGQAAPDFPIDQVVAGRLARLSVKNKVHRAAMVVAASTLGREDIPGLTSMFKQMDHDRSGQLSAAELRVALQRKGQRVSEAEAQRMVQQADKDGDGQVGLAELLAVALGKSSESRAQLLRALFAKLDTNGDELVSLAELGAVAGMEPSALPRELSQGPGLDFDGFVRFMEGFVEGSTTSLQEAVRRHPQCLEPEGDTASASGSAGVGGSSGDALSTGGRSRRAEEEQDDVEWNAVPLAGALHQAVGPGGSLRSFRDRGAVATSKERAALDWHLDQCLGPANKDEEEEEGEEGGACEAAGEWPYDFPQPLLRDFRLDHFMAELEEEEELDGFLSNMWADIETVGAGLAAGKARELGESLSSGLYITQYHANWTGDSYPRDLEINTRLYSPCALATCLEFSYEWHHRMRFYYAEHYVQCSVMQRGADGARPAAPQGRKVSVVDAEELGGELLFSMHEEDSGYQERHLMGSPGLRSLAAHLFGRRGLVSERKAFAIAAISAGATALEGADAGWLFRENRRRRKLAVGEESDGDLGGDCDSDNGDLKSASSEDRDAFGSFDLLAAALIIGSSLGVGVGGADSDSDSDEEYWTAEEEEW